MGFFDKIKQMLSSSSPSGDASSTDADIPQAKSGGCCDATDADDDDQYSGGCGGCGGCC